MEHSPESPTNPSQDVPAVNSDAVKQRFREVLTTIFARTHNISEEEPPGYLPLGILIVLFCEVLSSALVLTFKCHPQRTVAKNMSPGQNPSTDVALVMRVRASTPDSKYISKILYEYKPRVHDTF